MNTEPVKVSQSVPIRRTRWPSFFIGAAALVVSALLAAAFCGLLMLSSTNVDGALVIISFGLLWGTTFFLSFPRQRRYARALDARRPGISLADGVLAVPLSDDSTLHFKLDEPYELRFGWSEALVSTAAAPVMHTRSVLTYATVSQAGNHLFLKAEDCVRAARAAGWAQSGDSSPATHVVRLWAKDLIALVETLRARRLNAA